MIVVGKSLTKVYGGRGEKSIMAVDNLNITINKGEFVGIMGPSGSGKTTLLNLLSGIDKPSSGKVVIASEDITQLKKDHLATHRRENIGFVFQDFNLMDSLTVKENIMLPLILAEKNHHKMEEDALSVMEQVNIDKLMDKYPATLSGGEQQRVSICRAIITEPQVIFSDEPTGNLDSKSSKRIMNTFKELNEDQKRTMLMVTHDPFAASYCNRILFLVDGQIKLELHRGDMVEKDFLDAIMNSQTILMAGENS